MLPNDEAARLGRIILGIEPSERETTTIEEARVAGARARALSSKRVGSPYWRADLSHAFIEGWKAGWCPACQGNGVIEGPDGPMERDTGAYPTRNWPCGECDGTGVAHALTETREVE